MKTDTPRDQESRGTADDASQSDIIVASDGGEILEEEPGLSDEHLELFANLLDARVSDDLARENHNPEKLDYDPYVALEARDYFRRILEGD